MKYTELEKLLDRVHELEARVAVLEAHRAPPPVRYIPVVVNPLEQSWPALKEKTGKIK